MQPGSIEAHTHTHGIHAYVEQEVKGAITHSHVHAYYYPGERYCCEEKNNNNKNKTASAY